MSLGSLEPYIIEQFRVKRLLSLFAHFSNACFSWVSHSGPVLHVFDGSSCSNCYCLLRRYGIITPELIALEQQIDRENFEQGDGVDGFRTIAVPLTLNIKNRKQVSLLFSSSLISFKFSFCRFVQTFQ